MYFFGTKAAVFGHWLPKYVNVCALFIKMDCGGFNIIFTYNLFQFCHSIIKKTQLLFSQ